MRDDDWEELKPAPGDLKAFCATAARSPWLFAAMCLPLPVGLTVLGCIHAPTMVIASVFLVPWCLYIAAMLTDCLSQGEMMDMHGNELSRRGTPGRYWTFIGLWAAGYLFFLLAITAYAMQERNRERSPEPPALAAPDRTPQ